MAGRMEIHIPNHRTEGAAMTTTSTLSADFHQTEFPPDARHRLIEIARQQAELAAEASALIAALSGAPAGVADHVDDADHQQVDAPSPGDMIALKVVAHRWRRSERSMKKLASDHGALHRVGGRLMVDDARLRAGVFRHVFPLLDR